MQTDTILPAVLERLAEQVPAEDFEPITAFAKAYLIRLPPTVTLGVEHMTGQVRSLFEFIRVRDEPVKVRVFNPTLERDGYPSSGTVVEVNIEDSPFLLDSVTGEIHAHDLQVIHVIHPVIGIDRDPSGRLTAVRNARHTMNRESVEHYFLDRLLFEADLPGLERAIAAALNAVRAAVDDFHPMMARIDRMIDLVRVSVGAFPEGEIDEAVAFLQWLKQDNFVLLGYREYRLFDTPDGEAVQVVPGSGLGILGEEAISKVAQPVLLSSLTPELADRYRHGSLLVISKTNRLSPVHRRAKMDYVGVRITGPEGKTVGEARLVGLFTSKAYMEPASRTPIIRRKLAMIVAAEDLIEGSHDHKALVALLEGFSKHDLFVASGDDLRSTLVGMLALQEQNQVRLFVRRDLLERSVHILVALPRDRFNVELRKSLQDLFLRTFRGRTVDYHLALGEADPAQIHFTVWVDESTVPEFSFNDLEAQVVALTRSWNDQLAAALAESVGRRAAEHLAEVWGPRLPDYYKSSVSFEIAAGDVLRLEELTAGNRRFLVAIQNEPEHEQHERLTRIALYRADGKRPLNQLLPALVDLGLEVVEEQPTRPEGPGDLFIHDFGVLGPGRLLLDTDDTATRLCETLSAVWSGASDSDDLNRLVIVGGLRHDQVEILRAYRTYWRRVQSVFTVAYVNNTLVTHSAITAKLVGLFELRFHPESTGEGAEELRDEILADLDAVPSLEEDRILRAFLRLIEATLRTNAYLGDREALSFKLRSSLVPDMPLPYPMAEIFVFSATVEGIHLRGGPVARGGIRWSTRREDYRTEVLGLMKAQMTKNAVIVPTGAKGGYVLRRPPEDPAELREDVERQYRVFIGAMLDLTDNLVAGVVRAPTAVRTHDGEDPYLVVAADKGTATFSDVANSIALERGFWLGDAFASGGSSGYDHKALGITARGAWRSLERHFLELGIDPHATPFTAVGIGDMSGDVFGNGMLGSDQIQLVAAFDHRHIVLDPAPDPEASYRERRRLFDLPRSSWADYDQMLLSAGGGVYPRTAKRIDLSPEVRKVLGTDEESLTPSELIRVILTAPVDLLWNGGIGTYVKATSETHADVGDRSTDVVRVNASQLRCRVAVEGGNLGFTQLARIEFATAGGRINTDFIDNSGGVDCSDREVNLKILLGLALEQGELDTDTRNRLIADVVDDVVERILYDNFQQAQMLSQEEASSPRRMDAYDELMANLEQEGILDRVIEGLPPSEVMAERSRAGLGLSRPELAVLLADAKRSLKEAIVSSSLPEDPHLVADLGSYFPEPVATRFEALLGEHPLRRELVATMLANDVVNSEGVVFVSRLVAQTGATPAEVVAAYRTARDVSGAVERWEAIEGLFGKIGMEPWIRLMQLSDRAVAALTRWYLARLGSHSIGEVVAAHRPGFDTIGRVALEVGPAEWRRNRAEFMKRYEAEGVPTDLARRQAVLPVVVYGADVIQVAEGFGHEVEDALDVFLRIGRALGLDRLTEAARSIDPGARWQRWALWTVEEELLAVRRRAAERVLEVSEGRTGEEAVEHFLTERSEHVGRLVRFMEAFHADPGADVAPLMVALRQVRAALS